MSLINKYTDGLSEIEIYNDYKVNEKEQEELLKEIYDLCNEIARIEAFNEERIRNYFYSEEELDKIKKSHH